MNGPSYTYLPLTINLDALDILTPEQRSSIHRLMQSPNVQRMMVARQFDLPDTYVGFVTYKTWDTATGQGSVGTVGGIGPDGAVST